MLQYVSQLYVQVPLGSITLKTREMLQYDSNCMFRSPQALTLQAPEKLQYDSKLL